MTNIEIIEVVAGLCTIASLIVSLFTLNRVNKIYNKSTKKNKATQDIRGNGNTAAGRDISK